MGICGSKPYEGAEKKVVVIGGGYAGVKLCKVGATSCPLYMF